MKKKKLPNLDKNKTRKEKMVQRILTSAIRAGLGKRRKGDTWRIGGKSIGRGVGAILVFEFGSIWKALENRCWAQCAAGFDRGECARRGGGSALSSPILISASSAAKR